MIKKASLTVEAALALPIFIFVILFISYFIKVLYIQDNIQHALDQTANTLSTYAYAYDVMQLKDLQQEIYVKYCEQAGDIDTSIEQVYGSGEGIVDNISQFKESKDNLVNENSLQGIKEVKSTGDFNTYIDSCKEQVIQVKDTASNSLTGMIENIKSFSEGIQTILQNKDKVSGAVKID